MTASAGDSATPAPRWHTAVLVALYLLVAIAGLMSPHDASSTVVAAASNRIARAYLPLLFVQWMLVAYVARVGRPRGTLEALIGERPRTAPRLAGDLALAALAWVVITAVEIAWSRWVPGSRAAASATALLPHTGLERTVWIVVGLSVGFGEEVVFRGYFRVQFAALFGSVPIAIVLQALLFGLAHAEQGLAAAIRSGVYGLGLGVLAQQRRSLWPGIACHVWTDLASGLWRI